MDVGGEGEGGEAGLARPARTTRQGLRSRGTWQRTNGASVLLCSAGGASSAGTLADQTPPTVRTVSFLSASLYRGQSGDGANDPGHSDKGGETDAT